MTKEERLARAVLWHRLPFNFEGQLKRSLNLGYKRFHFDDGYDDVLEAARLLEHFGKRGVFFIVTGWVGLPGFASSDQLLELHERGHELGNHTAHHVLVPRVPMVVARAELEEAQQALTGLTGVTPRRLAWPYGLSSQATRDMADELGFIERRGIHDSHVKVFR